MYRKTEKIVEEATRKTSQRRKGFARQVMALTLAGSMLFGGVFTAQAANLKDAFDAKTYSNTYSDLKAAFGNDEKALYNHYVTYGLAENRVMSELIDVKKYRAAYADLDAAFGDNWDAYVNHYIKYGFKEGRNSFGKFDARAYADRYPDLKAAFGYDVLALWQHYLQYGRNEGRCAYTTVPGATSSSSSSSSNSGSSNTGSGNNTVPDNGNTGSGNNTVPSEPDSDDNQTTESVAVTGRMVDPETGEAIPNATIHAVPVGTVSTAVLTARSFAPAIAAVLSSVSGGDSTVSGSDSTVSGGDGTVSGGDNQIIDTAVTDENGNYQLNLAPGIYRLEVTAQGYIALVIENFVVNGDVTSESVPTVSLLSTSCDGETRVAGMLRDAFTGSLLAGVTVEFRANWGNTTGDVVATVTTDANGCYSVELPRGYYTATFVKDGYVTKSLGVVAVVNYTNYMQNEALNPIQENGTAGDYRIVLTWGERPRDLDSHLTAVADGTEVFHVAYYDKQYYDENGELVASLDVDDTSSYGPETVTVVRVNEDTNYRYSVHNFSEGYNADSTSMAQSGAQVTIYCGNELVRVCNVPTNQAGTIWNVFDIINGRVVFLDQPINVDRQTMYAEGVQ